ncbi:hypothetical protein [Alicycliphilus denitrificans]|uniref:Uncharacterized protein n=1 Tax=Alicycliphilus denitrificans TaxID=179636 RepID=A0A3R7HLY5_9BURK|nr:hypothetical protein [Alicycliphilus denitrificans]RKJ94543.1 hypothetical protein CE154_019710 [Alicycliphilus denitrificans]
MRVKVRPLQCKGRMLPRQLAKEQPPHIGALRVAEERDHELSRSVLRARLLDTQGGTEIDLLPDLSDARLLWANDNRLRFAGFERVDNANYAQTWEVEVV